MHVLNDPLQKLHPRPSRSLPFPIRGGVTNHFYGGPLGDSRGDFQCNSDLRSIASRYFCSWRYIRLSRLLRLLICPEVAQNSRGHCLTRKPTICPSLGMFYRWKPMFGFLLLPLWWKSFGFACSHCRMDEAEPGTKTTRVGLSECQSVSFLIE